MRARIPHQLLRGKSDAVCTYNHEPLGRQEILNLRNTTIDKGISGLLDLCKFKVVKYFGGNFDDSFN